MPYYNTNYTNSGRAHAAAGYRDSKIEGLPLSCCNVNS